MVEHEPGHATHAPRPGFGWAGSRTCAQDERVGMQPLGGGNDLLLRATPSDEVGDLDPGHRCRESLLPAD